MKSKTNTKWGENATRDNEEMTEVHISERKREDPLNKVSYYQHKPHEHVLIWGVVKYTKKFEVKEETTTILMTNYENKTQLRMRKMRQ